MNYFWDILLIVIYLANVWNIMRYIKLIRYNEYIQKITEEALIYSQVNSIFITDILILLPTSYQVSKSWYHPFEDWPSFDELITLYKSKLNN